MVTVYEMIIAVVVIFAAIWVIRMMFKYSLAIMLAFAMFAGGAYFVESGVGYDILNKVEMTTQQVIDEVNPLN